MEYVLDLTMPQTYLLLDGASYNSPDWDEETEEQAPKKSNKPPKPSEKDDPVGLLRWQLTYDNPLPMSPEEVEYHCKRFTELRAQNVIPS